MLKWTTVLCNHCCFFQTTSFRFVPRELGLRFSAIGRTKGLRGGARVRKSGHLGNESPLPRIDAMTGDVHRKTFAFVLVASLDRIARSTRNFLQIIDELDGCCIESIS